MLWLLLSLFTAMTSAVVSIFSKISLKDLDEYVASWLFRVITTLLLTPSIIVYGVPSLSAQFWYALFVSGSLNTLTTLLYMKSIKHADVSLVSPLLTFTPLFLLITSPLILGEYPTVVGMVGVVMIVVGAYLLNLNEMRHGLLRPLRLLVENRGARYMLLVAFIWSITSNYDKIGALSSSTLFWIFGINSYCSLLLTPFVLKNTTFKSITFQKLQPILIAGIMHTLMSVFQIAAITLTFVAYVIAIKRMNAIISVIFATFMLKEKGFKYRIAGSTVMVLGVVLISLFG
jgi:uncharacterized membrane protein